MHLFVFKGINKIITYMFEIKIGLIVMLLLTSSCQASYSLHKTWLNSSSQHRLKPGFYIDMHTKNLYGGICQHSGLTTWVVIE